MYPTLLRDREYPVAKSHTYGTMPVRRLVELAQAYGVIAEVRLRTEVPEYPLRRGDVTLYPVGEFWTVLAGPEIAQAARDSEIVECRQIVTYDMGRPFAGCMSRLLHARADARERGDRDGQAFAKLLANSLAGRCAMRQGGWVRDSKQDTPGVWGERYQLNATTGTRTRWRYVFGHAWRWDENSAAKGPHSAAFAYLTAYGRLCMRRYRDMAPDQSVVSQDTDGLYLLPTALETLRGAGLVGDGQPGQLRVVASADSAEFWTPRHYRFGADWVLAGLQYTDVDAAKLLVTYSQRTPLLQMFARETPTECARVIRQAPIPRDHDRAGVDPDGWTRPYRIVPARS